MPAPAPSSPDEEDIQSASERLLASAAPLERRSPWDFHGGVAPSELPGATQQASLWWERHSWVAPLADRLVGWIERRRPHPSQRAMQEAVEYYDGLYQERAPRADVFARLLLRNGIPDWPNPFPQGSDQHYSLHPEGIIAADLAVILDGLTSDWDAGARPPGPGIDEVLGSANPFAPEPPPAAPAEAELVTTTSDEDALAPDVMDDLSASAMQAATQRLEKQDRERARDQARHQWLQMVMSGLPFARLGDTVHPDNLFLATQDAARSAERLQLRWSYEDIAQQAQRRGWGTAPMWQLMQDQSPVH